MIRSGRRCAAMRATCLLLRRRAGLLLLLLLLFLLLLLLLLCCRTDQASRFFVNPFCEFCLCVVSLFCCFVLPFCRTVLFRCVGPLPRDDGGAQPNACARAQLAILQAAAEAAPGKPLVVVSACGDLIWRPLLSTRVAGAQAAEEGRWRCL